MQTKMQINSVEDETAWFNFGDEAEQTFYSFEKSELGLSYNDNFPTQYKIAGMSIFRDGDLHVVARETYDTFALLGDIGGVNEIIYLLGVFLC